MKEIKVLIVEDDLSFALELSMLIEEIGYEVIKITDNSEEALQLIKSQDPDVILMDIDIKGQLNGLQVVNRIKDLNIPILFITSHGQANIYDQAKEMTAVGFLVKPVEKLTLRSTIEISLRNLALNKSNSPTDSTAANKDFILKDYFFIKKNNSLQKVGINEIFFVESARNYSVIQTEDKKFIIRSSLRSMENQLASAGFIRIHRGYLVNIKKIERLQMVDNKLFAGKFELPVGRSYRSDLLDKIQTLE